MHEPIHPVEGRDCDPLEPGALVIGDEAGEVVINSGRRSVVLETVNTRGPANLRGFRRRRARHMRTDATPAACATLHAALNAKAAARIGIGGPVGSGKTALIERLIPVLHRHGTDLAGLTNDLVTQEDAERVRRSGLIDPARVLAVEAGACPHTVMREHPTLNIAAADELETRFPGLHLIISESGGDNLASTFSLDLVDW